MTDQTLLQQIGEANKSFLSGTPRMLDPAGEPFAVIACIDPRLTGLLEPALGLPRHRAAVIRTAGNQLSDRTRDALRSIAVALFVKNAREIIVVGHTDCGLAGFSAAEVAESFRKAGVPRTAFGEEDLRTWFGAFPNIRDNVIATVAYLRKSSIVPQGARIHGLVMDTDKGAIEVVVDGYLAPALQVQTAPEPENQAAAARPAEQEASTDTTYAGTAPQSSPAEQRVRKGPVIVATAAAPVLPHPDTAAPHSVLEAAMILRDFVQREGHKPRMKKAVLELKTVWQREKSPSSVLSELQKVVKDFESQYPHVPGAVAYLENAVRSGGTDRIGFADALRRILS